MQPVSVRAQPDRDVQLLVLSKVPVSCFVLENCSMCVLALAFCFVTSFGGHITSFVISFGVQVVVTYGDRRQVDTFNDYGLHLQEDSIELFNSNPEQV